MDPFLELQRLVTLPKALPRVVLSEWPTPVSRLARLSERLGYELWVKADHQPAALYGGNKVRKLELLLADAKSKGARSVLTIGGIGSHQVTAVARLAPSIGAVPAAVVYPRPVTPWVRANAALWERAKIRLFPVTNAADWEHGMQLAHAALPSPVFLVPTGASSPLGNLGFVAAGLELALQIASGELARPAEIAMACGSGGTVAGLMLGLALAKLSSTRILAVRCGSADICSEITIRRQVDALTKQLVRLGGRLGPLDLPDLVLVDSGVAYGELTAESSASMQLARDEEGLELEPTYTAHVLTKLRERAKGATSGPVLFWQTNQPLSIEGYAGAETPEILAPWLSRA